MNEPLTLDSLKASVTKQSFVRNIIFFESIDSTNTYAKTLSGNDLQHGSVIVAEEQTSGKGRLGRSWNSSNGQNLTFSVIIKPELDVKLWGVCSLAASIAVAEAIQHVTSIIPTCKWPNDVLINKKKVCGILLETMNAKDKSLYLIIGIGINVNQTDFPSEIQTSATSLAIVAGSFVNRLALFASILRQLEIWYVNLSHDKIHHVIHRWKQLSRMIGSTISVKQNGVVLTGIVVNVHEDGGLILQTAHSRKILYAGDVTIMKE